MWDLAQVLQAGDGKAFCALRPAQHVRSSRQIRLRPSVALLLSHL